ncbi:MAG: host attachment protein [Anaerolineales bacterium]|uniref:Host attachment protein n=1 Tax=candidate division WWE3 bacterium TaxID=2053526 RepID=A0A928TTV3_UNCKA|nr:host attachment protein [Anaerolineales bacterium]MBE7525211.1 host attachment protein [candidate division WWE3 bacterium]
MQLPKDLQHFPDPTLIVLTDEQEARIFLAGGDAYQTLDSLALPREFKSDAEGSFVSSDGSRVGGPSSDLHDTPRKEAFAKTVAEAITRYVREGHAVVVHLVSPPEMLHLIQARLPADVKPHIAKTLAKDLMKNDILDVIKRLFTLPGA